ncbi:MAG TPA: DUF5615 family PIN-like protein [Candidatus Acidoferrales bacterium]|jgi:hypothetical protein|nr:DUF5615 family PIN-like protein [Candidatus Acidoferrales bacterium]
MEVHVRRAVTTALRLRSIDVLTAQEDGSAELADDVLLERATELGRVLVSQDEDLLHEGARWLSEGKDFSGIIYSHQLRIMIGQMVDDLEMIARATSQDEWWGRSNICRFGERALLVHRTPWRLGL